MLVVALNNLYKRNPNDLVSWVDTPDDTGLFLFTFDGETVFNLFEDYPYKLTAEQVTIFDKENPHWANYFEDRKGRIP